MCLPPFHILPLPLAGVTAIISVDAGDVLEQALVDVAAFVDRWLSAGHSDGDVVQVDVAATL
jgi:hypothetical protein